jgi:tetratricopeptide (TPR) repeat protein
MTDSRQDEALVRAFELIEEERLAEARELVQSVLDDDSQNADAWWIYAHAVEDRADARRALNKVAEIDPNYDGLQELLTYYDDDVIDPSDGLDTLDDDFDFVDEGYDQITEQPFIAEHPENPWPRRIVIITVILLLAFVGYLILNSARRDGTEEPTQVAVMPTNESVILLPEDEIDQTSDIPEEIQEEIQIESEELTEENFEESLPVSELSLILGDYSLANDEFVFLDTVLGTTQTINLCNDNRESLRDTIQNTLMAFSNNLGLIELDTQSIAIRILDCNEQETLSFIGVSMENVTLYEAGEITDQEFIGTWTVLD